MLCCVINSSILQMYPTGTFRNKHSFPLGNRVTPVTYLQNIYIFFFLVVVVLMNWRCYQMRLLVSGTLARGFLFQNCCYNYNQSEPDQQSFKAKIAHFNCYCSDNSAEGEGTLGRKSSGRQLGSVTHWVQLPQQQSANCTLKFWIATNTISTPLMP